MNKENIIRSLNESGLDLVTVWVTCCAAMVMYNLRESTSDINLGCSNDCFEILIENYKDKRTWPDGMRSIEYNNIEIFKE